jgi:hypothetical protein
MRSYTATVALRSWWLVIAITREKKYDKECPGGIEDYFNGLVHKGNFGNFLGAIAEVCYK